MENLNNSDIEVRLCRHGRGVFARRSYRPGEDILRFTGPQMSHEEVVATDTLGNPLQCGMAQYIDLDPPGVWVNHSCAPNAGVREDQILVARKNIAPSTEILWDYSTSMDEDDWTMNCNCGSPHCRQEVRDFKYLPTSVQDSYLEEGLVMKYIAAQYGSRSGSRRVDRSIDLTLPR